MAAGDGLEGVGLLMSGIPASSWFRQIHCRAVRAASLALALVIGRGFAALEQ
jgi:hypothetical protein